MALLARFIGLFGTGEAVPGLDEALGRAVSLVDSRLPQASGWPKRYRAPLARALEQVDRVARAIPGPVTLDAESFQFDPLVHTLFASTQQMQEVIRDSQAIRDYVAAGGKGEAYLLLTAYRQERQVFGVDDEGGVLRRDVPQRLVWFSEHQLEGPAPTLAEARKGLTWTLFDRFLERVRVGFERIRQEKERLGFEKDMAFDRLRSARGEDRPDLQRALDGVLKQLGDTLEDLELNHLHEVFETVLSHPEDCLYVEAHSLIMDRMNRLHPQARGEATVSVGFLDIVERYRKPRTAVLVYCQDIQQIAKEEKDFGYLPVTSLRPG